MSKEIYYQGWLIKSPPTKRIWRARWRRRWFTLKQGEIPEQFCLEYYTDDSCRKSKGVIDLDQCEQVDSGLQLEHRNQKFQHMFAVKTPHRIYYLAADSGEDMKRWVNCICEVCNLQDSPPKSDGNISYHCNGAVMPVENQPGTSDLKEVPVNPMERNDNASVYQNVTAIHENATYHNRETVICDTPWKITSPDSSMDYYNSIAIRLHTPDCVTKDSNGMFSTPFSVDRKTIGQKSTPLKIPENLKLNSSIVSDSIFSPTGSSSTGPYIEISQCISGISVIDRDNPITPLNTLNPKFHNQQGIPRSGKSSPTDSESVFDSEEDFALSNPNEISNGERVPRPSESSIENDTPVITCERQFVKDPNVKSAIGSKTIHSKRTNSVKRLLIEKTDSEDQNKDVNSSDTENASPAIGPKDASSYVEESYDIPRSHRKPYTENIESCDYPAGMSPKRMNTSMLELNESRPNSKAFLNCGLEPSSSTMPRKGMNWYTNAAPTKVEGNVFRYEFEEQSEAPAVNRNLKPKSQNGEAISKLDGMLDKSTRTPSIATPSMLNSPFKLEPPCIDRTRKPTTPNKPKMHTMQRRQASLLSEFQGGSDNEPLSKTLPRIHMNSSSTLTTPRTPTVSIQSQPKPILDYFDLDHSNPPPICNNSNTSASTSNLSFQSGFGISSDLSNRIKALGMSSHSVAGMSKPDSSHSLIAQPVTTGIVYKELDFVKTNALKQMRQDAESKRAQELPKE